MPQYFPDRLLFFIKLYGEVTIIRWSLLCLTTNDSSWVLLYQYWVTYDVPLVCYQGKYKSFYNFEPGFSENMSVAIGFLLDKRFLIFAGPLSGSPLLALSFMDVDEKGRTFISDDAPTLHLFFAASGSTLTDKNDLESLYKFFKLANFSPAMVS